VFILLFVPVAIQPFIFESIPFIKSNVLTFAPVVFANTRKGIIYVGVHITVI